MKTTYLFTGTIPFPLFVQELAWITSEHNKGSSGIPSHCVWWVSSCIKCVRLHYTYVLYFYALCMQLLYMHAFYMCIENPVIN